MSPRFITGGADQSARLWDISLPLITTVPFMELTYAIHVTEDTKDHKLMPGATAIVARLGTCSSNHMRKWVTRIP
ncbi:hypothetical protein HID58_016862 [Brassica napus]|uniref:Uncharacterized protein n=1 Tax=Brassica napus TaxID=3708 RepID=A0ABQ8D868_BRANA|nr:hypothetical protein HID58_016862 [Brassica napus]